MNVRSKTVKMQEENISMIQMHLLSVQILWMAFMRILIITTQAEKEKNYSCLNFKQKLSSGEN